MERVKSFGCRIFMLMVVTLLCVQNIEANYRLSSFNGNVKIKHAGQLSDPVVGMRLGISDLIIIGQGSKVEILDKRDSKLYSRDKAGEIGITSLIFEAQKSSHSNLKTVYRNLSMGKNSSTEDGKMYIEKGKVTLALEEYDPGSQNLMIDAKVMARYIFDLLNVGISDTLYEFPVPIEVSKQPAGSLSFKVDNNSSEPLYMNVLKFLKVNGELQLQISELGQPVGCYIILPNQTIMRGQSEGVKSGCVQLLVATHYYFSIDELISELSEFITETTDNNEVMLNLPIYIHKF